MSRIELWNQLLKYRTNRSADERKVRRSRTSRVRVEQLESRRLLMADFTLELLHAGDQEAATAAIQDAPRFSAVLNALRAEDLGGDGVADNTITLSSGDAFIPSLFFDASEVAFGSGGIADIQIQNELGFEAIALGNHEFDFGTGTLASLIDGSADGSILGADFDGTDFPYLSTNLDFSTDAALAPLGVAGGAAPLPNTVSSSTIIDVNGESVAVIGATTPTLASISSPGGVGISPAPFDPNPTPDQLDALAGEIQAEVDAVLDANPGINKVILLAHMQQIDIELGLAERLQDVDIIVAGGSNTRLFDSNDRVRDGDSNQGEYPQFVDNAGGSSTAVVNTDGSYKYVGRLVIGFDPSGNIMPETYDANVSGAYATDAQGVADLAAADLVDPEIQEIVDAVEAQIIATESNVFGVSEVFLNGNRSGADTGDDPDGVRTQETNLGNLTADANLAEAQKGDSDVVISIKNGGGIRASIGQVVVPPGGTDAVRLPNEAVVDSNGNLIKPEGGISQNDIQTTLAFNNGLTLLTLTRDELINVLEHGVGAIPSVSGRFPQISGVKFSYDPSLPEGSRIISAGVFDEAGNLKQKLVEDGQRVGDAEATYRVVSLDFLVAPRFDSAGNYTGGGDDYPWPNTNTNPALGEVATAEDLARINLVQLEQAGTTTGDAQFTDDGTEQDALAEYLSDNFGDAENAFSEADAGRVADRRIQNVAFRADTVFPISGTIYVTNELNFGDGSFRNAVQTASDHPGVKQIRFAHDVDLVMLESPVEYTGQQDLKISGNGVVLQASDDFAGPGVFVSSAGADLALSRLTVDGDFEEGESPANGIYVPVPADAEGRIKIRTDRVNIINNGLHGLHIADQINDSAASIDLIMRRTDVINNGIGVLDYDGVRVDEGGEGDLHAKIQRSNIDGNGGDGLELDERGPGSVNASVSHTTFNDNGFFDENFDPDDPNNDREEQDLDDGFDIDEAGSGGIRVDVRSSEAVNNFDEGFDFDEEDEGGVWMRFRDVLAEGNSDEGIKAGEEDEGGFVASLFNIQLLGNGDDDKSVEQDGGEGMQLSEEDEGDFYANISHIEAVGNGSQGIKVEEDGDGRLSVVLSRAEIEANGSSGLKIEEAGAGALIVRLDRVDSEANEGDGAELLESGDGILVGSIRRSDFDDNEDYGLVVKQEDDGFGLLRVWQVEAEDNGEGAVDSQGVRLLGRIRD